MTLNVDDAREIQRPPIKVGGQYTFYCEVQQEYEPPEKRLRRFTGTLVTVLRNLRGPNDEDPEYDGPGPNDTKVSDDPESDDFFEVSRVFEVQAHDGTIFTAHEEEISGWDCDLGQFFWPDGTHGPEHDETFLVAERAQGTVKLVGMDNPPNDMNRRNA